MPTLPIIECAIRDALRLFPCGGRYADSGLRRSVKGADTMAKLDHPHFFGAKADGAVARGDRQRHPRMVQAQPLTANQITSRIGLRPIKGMSGARLWYGD